MKTGQRWRYFVTGSHDMVVEATDNCGSCVVLQANEISVRTGYTLGSQKKFGYLTDSELSRYKSDGSTYSGWSYLVGQDVPA
jgi:hypothetical protein